MKFYFLEAPSIFFSRNIIHGETNNSGHVCEQISLIRLCVCVCVGVETPFPFPTQSNPPPSSAVPSLFLPCLCLVNSSVKMFSSFCRRLFTLDEN